MARPMMLSRATRHLSDLGAAARKSEMLGRWGSVAYGVLDRQSYYLQAKEYGPTRTQPVDETWGEIDLAVVDACRLYDGLRRVQKARLLRAGAAV